MTPEPDAPAPPAQNPPAPPVPPASPKSASTVVLLRDLAASGVEVLLVRRHGSMGFMGGMHVFPGGKVAAGDTAPALRARLTDAGAVAAEHPWGEGVDALGSLGRAVAGVRETFEEACLLFADVEHELSALRAELLAGADFGALLEREQLALKLTELHPLSRWITPESEPVRFDTSFYVARAPRGQRAAHDEGEAVASVWYTPAAALAAAAAGQIRLAPPTARTLEGLLGVATTEQALALADRRPPPVILPIIRTEGSEVVILYPGDPEHPVREQALEGSTRRVMRRL